MVGSEYVGLGCDVAVEDVVVSLRGGWVVPARRSLACHGVELVGMEVGCICAAEASW